MVLFVHNFEDLSELGQRAHSNCSCVSRLVAWVCAAPHPHPQGPDHDTRQIQKKWIGQRWIGQKLDWPKLVSFKVALSPSLLPSPVFSPLLLVLSSLLTILCPPAIQPRTPFPLQLGGSTQANATWANWPKSSILCCVVLCLCCVGNFEDVRPWSPF